MREDFNRKVFDTMPDTVYTGPMPSWAEGAVRNAPLAEYPSQASRRSYRPIYLAVAAGLAALLAVSTAVMAVRLSRPAPVPSAELVATSEIVYTVNSALQGRVVLPDSSLVTLNSGSRLRVAEDFGTGTRSVYLDGEACFDVRRNRDVPFLIHTPQDVLVRVTGTRFNLSCFSDAPKFDLTLLQGSVEVTTRAKETIRVTPSQEIVINSDFHNVSHVDAPEESLAWMGGILRFDHTPMRETIARIERWYGVDVIVEDESVYRSSFTAEFRSETLSEVLDLLSITSRLEYSVNDRKVTLKPASR